MEKEEFNKMIKEYLKDNLKIDISVRGDNRVYVYLTVEYERILECSDSLPDNSQDRSDY